MSSHESEKDRWFSDEIEPHEPGLRAWLKSRYPSLGDVDDIIQDSFIRVIKARQGSVLLAPKAFLYATARNLALDQLRHRQVIRMDSLASFDDSNVIDEQSDLHEAVARNQELAILTEAIQSLPDQCRRIFTLRKVYGLSQREISLRLGISENTVSAQLTIGFKRCSAYVLERTRQGGSAR